MDFGDSIGLFAKQASAWAKNLIYIESDLMQVEVLKQGGYEALLVLLRCQRISLTTLIR